MVAKNFAFCRPPVKMNRTKNYKTKKHAKNSEVLFGLFFWAGNRPPSGVNTTRNKQTRAEALKQAKALLYFNPQPATPSQTFPSLSKLLTLSTTKLPNLPNPNFSRAAAAPQTAARPPSSPSPPSPRWRPGSDLSKPEGTFSELKLFKWSFHQGCGKRNPRICTTRRASPKD